MAPKAKPAKKTYDYSDIEKGISCQAESEGGWYAAEVIAVSTSKARAKAPVKVSFKGWEGYDEWVSGDRLRSKALKVTVEEKQKPKKTSQSHCCWRQYSRDHDRRGLQSHWEGGHGRAH